MHRRRNFLIAGGDGAPYAEYTIRITAPGFKPFLVSGTEVLAEVTAIQGIRLRPLSNAPTGEQTETVTIPDHTLYGDYLPKIAESEIKPVTETGEIVLSRVVVPQTIVVHDGAPTNASAPDYYVPYRDYIKNVASSEICATWPRSGDRCECAGDHVLHVKPRLHGMVPQPGI